MHVKKKEITDQDVKEFDYFMFAFVIVNAIILLLKWPNMSPSIEQTVAIITYVCTCVFILEAVLKLAAFGKAYFRDGWNRFDFIIVIGSLIFIAPSFK